MIPIRIHSQVAFNELVSISEIRLGRDAFRSRKDVIGSYKPCGKPDQSFCVCTHYINETHDGGVVDLRRNSLYCPYRYIFYSWDYDKLGKMICLCHEHNLMYDRIFRMRLLHRHEPDEVEKCLDKMTKAMNTFTIAMKETLKEIDKKDLVDTFKGIIKEVTDEKGSVPSLE